MRNVAAALNRQRLIALSRLSHPTLQNGTTFGTTNCNYLFMGDEENIRLEYRRSFDWIPSNLARRRHFSTGFTSIHGERPSAEYAKLRKESLETEFGHAVGTYSSGLSAYLRFGPFLALYRAAYISFHVVKLSMWHFFLKDIHKRAIKFRETLIRLGPFYIKLGQALSTRSDIMPTAYCQELAKLQDQIPPFPTPVAMKSIESQLGVPVSQIFADISPEPVAAASLGQVYKAHLHSGELVAVKVQRPGMSLRLTLDALLFHMIGGQMKRFAMARKDLLVAVNEMVRHMFKEIDYIREAQNAERFASLYGSYRDNVQNVPKRTSAVDDVVNKKVSSIKVPKIHWNLTRKTVLTMEWIEGIKLTDADRIEKACLNRKGLIDMGLYCSLRQLLEVGFFHADPHPGNLVATADGSLAYFDFGMMGDIPRHYRVGLIQVGIMNQLYNVMYEFNFSLPPDYALVIRALGSLEGTAKALDPDFKVVESAYPFVIGRLLADPSPDMRKILRELLICNDGSIRWRRLERLIAAISEQASESEGPSSSSTENTSNAFGWKSFDMRAVVASTEDLFNFILSEKGQRVRIFLVQDIIRAADTFLKEASPCILNGFETKETSHSEKQEMMRRVVTGFQSLRQAIKLAPEVWAAMLIRMAVKPDVHKFTVDVISALAIQLGRRFPEESWLCLSRFLHKLHTCYRQDDL
ncbi:uncharacterized protein sll0005 isoform X3 [Macadamia integrifolia]|uniref:uncharacterized protein sll0005 isoform X3 n=1 Tax=Macadamia integrifolia TaxID=60698 RepID=UPI001C4EBB13|nr:uncharacterized protein sll0005 isoform X3 [Macadamia integrifolia]